MPKSRHRKNHKQKAAARKQRLINEKKSFEKKQRDFIMQLIEQEKQRGLFEENTNGSIDMPIFNGVEESIIEGPTI
jgi:hypothetical protein